MDLTNKQYPQVSTKSYIICFSFGVLLYNATKIAQKLFFSNKSKDLRVKKVNSHIFQAMKDTPIIYIQSLSERSGCKIYAKCESYLPYTSKDRIVKNIFSQGIRYILHK